MISPGRRRRACHGRGFRRGPDPGTTRPARGGVASKARWFRLPVAVVLGILVAIACRGPERKASRESAPATIPAPSNLLLITVDTLRADHLSGYGYARPTSPQIDRLAGEGVRFTAAQVQWPKTGPSFASIMTATYSKDNGIVRQVGVPLSCRFRMLAEELAALGYGTHAVVANGALGREFYFDQGFDTYMETWKARAPAPGEDPNRAEVVTHLALEAARRIDRGRPFFLWVHYLDPHFPYAPPPAWRDRFQHDQQWSPLPRVAVFLDKPQQQMTGIGREQVLDGHDELAFYVARYDAEIAYTDAQVGALLAGLSEQGLMAKTLTLFTSDHGESLGEHEYYFDHGRFGFQTCLRVPLIAHYPGVIQPRVDTEPVELLSLAPTLLEAAGARLDQGHWMQGQSLGGRLVGAPGQTAEPPTGSALAFAEAGYQSQHKWLHIVRDRRFKLTWAPTRPDQRWIGGEGVAFTLHDLDQDPDETTNVADHFPTEVERLKRALWSWREAPPFAVEREQQDCGATRPMDRETEDLLRSLGYLR